MRHASTRFASTPRKEHHGDFFGFFLGFPKVKILPFLGRVLQILVLVEYRAYRIVYFVTWPTGVGLGRASNRSSSTRRDDRCGIFFGIFGVHLTGEN